jgi:hypothetical protein
MTAPTEKQIRRAIADNFPLGRPGGNWGCYADDLLGFGIEAGESVFASGRIGEGGAIWQESDELREVIDRAASVASKQCQAIIVEALVGALVAYAETHPDAPLARREEAAA